MTASVLGARCAPGQAGDPQAVVEAFLAVRRLTESLASPLSAEDQTVQSMPDVSPTKWHRAHTSWFFETFLLGPYLEGYEVFDDRFGFLFNSYYVAAGDRYPRPERGHVSRPGVAEVARYRRHVDSEVVRLLDRSAAGRLAATAASVLELGLHHEQQHQELLLMDIKHVLSKSPLDPVYATGAGDDTAPPHRPGWLAHPGGDVRIGHEGGGFAFDNEGPAHEVKLLPFELADSLVTCGQWLAFIADGGYRRPELWLSDGWATAEKEAWEAPLYWRREGRGTYSLFTLSGRRLVEEAEPVCHVSYYEADAFARWAGARLATELEWEALAAPEPVAGQFLEPGRLHPKPASGPRLYGGAWTWTSSAYLPYPRYRPPAGAIGEYNGKFMVNQQVLRGGSCATPPGHLRASYRNFFPPSARWPFTGVRLARDLEAG